MLNIMFVAIGGALGTLARYLIYNLDVLTFTNENSAVFSLPYATIIVNILGSFLIALIVGYVAIKAIKEQYFIGITAGFCGGFTTVSALASDIFLLSQHTLYLELAAYFMLTMVGGLLSVLLGLGVGKGLAER